MSEPTVSVKVQRGTGEKEVALSVSFIHDGVQYHNGVMIPDNATAKVLASKLDILAFWIRDKAGVKF